MTKNSPNFFFTCEHFIISAVLTKILIFIFFKPQSKTLDDFPKELTDPNWPLSKIVPPSAIKMANNEERAVGLQLNLMTLDQCQTCDLES